VKGRSEERKGPLTRLKAAYLYRQEEDLRREKKEKGDVRVK